MPHQSEHTPCGRTPRTKAPPVGGNELRPNGHDHASLGRRGLRSVSDSARMWSGRSPMSVSSHVSGTRLSSTCQPAGRGPTTLKGLTATLYPAAWSDEVSRPEKRTDMPL